MAKEFFHPDMELFVDHRVDWQRYLRLSRREAADVTGEIDTYKMILRTLAEICEDIDARAGEHWHEEVRVEDGRVVVPPHVAQAYEKLRSAGLVSSVSAVVVFLCCGSAGASHAVSLARRAGVPVFVVPCGCVAAPSLWD